MSGTAASALICRFLAQRHKHTCVLQTRSLQIWTVRSCCRGLSGLGSGLEAGAGSCGSARLAGRVMDHGDGGQRGSGV